MRRCLKQVSPLIPYISVVLGLYVLGSAWLAIVFYHVGVLAVVLVSKVSLGSRWIRSDRLGWWLSTTSVFALGGVALYALWPCTLPSCDLVKERLADYGITRQVWPLFAIYFCLANSFVEEIFWRGYLRDDSHLPTTNDFAFAGYHAAVLIAFASLIWAPLVVFVCIFAAWLWRIMHRATGSLMLPIVTHFVADVSIAIAVYYRVFK